MKEFHVDTGPFIKDKNSTNKMMKHLLFSLLPIIIFSVYKNGIIPFLNGKVTMIGLIYPLIFILLGPLFTMLTELIYFKFFLKLDKEELKTEFKNSFSLFPGLFLSLVLPLNTPLPILLFGSIMATVVGKLVYGGFGNNIFNPALIGYLFVILIYGQLIATHGGYLNPYELDAITTATPLSNIALGEGIGTYSTLVKPYGNLFTFFLGFIPGTLGETSTLLCLMAFLYLVLFKIIKWKIPVVYLGTVFIMTSIIGTLNGLGFWYPLFQVMSGGLMFGAVFMATDPVTSPTTPIGQILYGLFLGLLTVLIRYLTPYPEGVMISLLTLNMFVFILDNIGFKARFNFNRAVFSFVFAWFLILSLSIYVGHSFKIQATFEDPNFNVIKKEIQGERATYIVTQKGFGGNIKGQIEIVDNQISSVEVLENNDSYYSKITDTNYFDKLKGKQLEIEKVDTISGATITSRALKDMVINTLKDYEVNK